MIPLVFLLLASHHPRPSVVKPAAPLPTQAAAPVVFTDTERAALVSFWAAPGRTQSRLAPPRVALTPEASIWLSAYNRASRAASPADKAAWKTWVEAKQDRDHWLAGQTLSISTDAEPPVPGLIPASLLTACGDPPPLAAPVTPRQWTIDLSDGGDPLTYTDHVAVRPTSAYYRSDQGVISGGTPLRKVPQAEMDSLFAAAGLSPFERHVMQGVSPLEGGFDAVNTYDTGYVSVGFIQFITARDGTGSLISVLAQEKVTHPTEFRQDFHQRGIDLNAAGAYTVVDPATGAELTGGDAVAKTISDPRLVAVFQSAGRRSVAFRAAQVAIAKRAYYPADDPLTVTLPDGSTLTGKVSDAIRSEAGIATLFDRKVNTGTITPALPDAIAAAMTQHQVKTWDGLTPYERDVVAAIKYRADFLDNPGLTQPPPLTK